MKTNKATYMTTLVPFPLPLHCVNMGFLTKLLSCQKVQNSDFQSQFSKSEIILTFAKKDFMEQYHFWENFFLLTFFYNSI